VIGGPFNVAQRSSREDQFDHPPVGRKHVARAAVRVFGGVGIVAVFFFVTLFVLNYMDSRARDALRVEHLKVIMAALEKYHGTRGAYPVFTPAEVDVGNLKQALVDGKYLATIPNDPFWPDKPYHYASFTGGSYGLLIHLELANGKITAGGTCMVVVRAPPDGWWGRPPDCPI
jgi:hypothetical protein